MRRLVLALVCVSVPTVGYAQNVLPKQQLDGLIAAATADHDDDAVQRLQNLRAGMARLRPTQLVGVICGMNAPASKSSSAIDVALDKAGELLDKALDKYFPNFAAALTSTTAAAVATFLAPQDLAADPVDIVNTAAQQRRSAVRDAARQILQDTTSANFAMLPAAFVSKLVVCGF